MNGFKPMLAGKCPEDLNDLVFPVLVSPKLDGIRCMRPFDGQPLMSRKLKPIPNAFVQSVLGPSGACVPVGFDGELMLRDNPSFNAVQSAVMREDGEPDFVYHVFDIHCTHGGFKERYRTLCNVVGAMMHKRIVAVPHLIASNVDELLALEGRYLEQGYEGAMVRSIDGPYKFGRSSTKQGFLLKLKRFEDAEAEIIGCIELMHNDNVATKDELGRTKRSSHKANKRASGTLGAFLVRRADGVEFEIGTGFTAEQRENFWCLRDDLIGSHVTYKFQPDPSNTEGKYKPRFPVFLHFRDQRDMSA